MSKKNFINQTHVEGYVYEHSLELRTSGENSKNPGTVFIMGNLDIATDEECTNVISVHFTYVTEKTKSGANNATFGVLKNIIEGKAKNVMQDGKENAAKVRIDSAIALNEFYSDRSGTEELVSVKRNEGGFVHIIDAADPDIKTHNTFKADMLITGVTHTDADEEKGVSEKVTIKGCIFNFRKDLMPVEFSVTNGGGMDYFMSLGASSASPVFTCVWGRQISTTVRREITTESAFGEPEVRVVNSTRKDWVVTGANPVPYDWDSEETVTAAEVKEMMANREVYLASIKQRQDEYKAQKAAQAAAPVATAPQMGDFKF